MLGQPPVQFEEIMGGRDYEDMTDEELLHAWCAGDRMAGKELFDRYYEIVERFFHNKVAEPDDLIQRTFLGCLEAAHRYRGASKFRTYLLGIANNVRHNHYRRLQKERGVEPLEATSMEDLDQRPSRLLVEREEERLLLAGLRHLPIELQLLLELRYWDGLKHREIAEVLQTPMSTVSTRLCRARELLKERLTELAESPEKLHSTLTKLEDWAEQQRQRWSTPNEDDEGSEP